MLIFPGDILVHLLLWGTVCALLRGKGYGWPLALLLGFFWCVGVIVWVFTEPKP